MHVIPHSWSHLHILISVFPSIGLVIGLGFYIAGLRAGNDFVRRTGLALFGALGLLSVPIAVSGFGSMAALSGDPRFSSDDMRTHYIWGIAALIVLLLAGAAALFALWRAWRARRAATDPFHLVLGLAAVSLGLTVVADELGWQLNHNELQSTNFIADISTNWHDDVS